ncbi:hypothetical protein DPMN_018658 [Dreissena polymorpha]|uniref:Uncharacterized protein n=1 Tax=Dreissena polymorpha TaxID=45954 RepID=A0A9D4NGY9_DREPO|nr:hypothetical protein DPMN_018658 [Dreissena polymorpha]
MVAMFFYGPEPVSNKIIHIEKTAPLPESHIFQPILTIFELVHDINKTNILTKFHDWETIHGRKTATPPGGHVFQPTRTSLSFFDQKSVEFHEDRTRNAFTRQRFTTDTGLSHFTMRTKVLM